MAGIVTLCFTVNFFIIIFFMIKIYKILLMNRILKRIKQLDTPRHLDMNIKSFIEYPLIFRKNDIELITELNNEYNLKKEKFTLNIDKWSFLGIIHKIKITKTPI
jgi:hypothetical protein